jgi:hypothetical protein
MNMRVFNLSIALGWAMLTIGACLVSLAVGLITGGITMLAIVAALTKFAGVYVPRDGQQTARTDG